MNERMLVSLFRVLFMFRFIYNILRPSYYKLSQNYLNSRIIEERFKILILWKSRIY